MSKLPPIDPRVVSELRGLMGDAYLTVYEAFIRSCDQNMTDLSAAVKTSELQLIQSIAHTLKGSSANIGAGKFSEISKRIMDDARNGLASDYRLLLDDLQQEYDRVRDVIITFK